MAHIVAEHAIFVLAADHYPRLRQPVGAGGVQCSVVSKDVSGCFQTLNPLRPLRSGAIYVNDSRDVASEQLIVHRHDKISVIGHEQALSLGRQVQDGGAESATAIDAQFAAGVMDRFRASESP